jgi:hypothetical protein
LTADIRASSAHPQGGLLALAITHIFPRQIKALLAFLGACPSVLSRSEGLRSE